jgi:hypothetical protein
MALTADLIGSTGFYGEHYLDSGQLGLDALSFVQALMAICSSSSCPRLPDCASMYPGFPLCLNLPYLGGSGFRPIVILVHLILPYLGGLDSGQ